MISICAFSVSARKSLSFIVAMNALRSASARSGGMFGGADERPAHHLAREDQPQDLPLLVGLGEIDDQRHVRQVGMLVERELHQDGELLLVEPFLVGRFHARPRPAAAALHLAALHGEADLVAARIAGDDLHLGAEHAVGDPRELVGVRRGAGAADDQLRVSMSSNLVMPLVFQATQMLTSLLALPIQVNLVASNCAALLPSSGSKPVPRPMMPKAVPSFGRDVVEPVRQPQAARAFHVLRQHVRIAGNVLAHVSREHARIEVVGAADAVADVEIDGLALVEIGHALARGSSRRATTRKAAARRPRVNTLNTMFLPLERSPLCGGCTMRPLSSPQDCFDKNTRYGAATIRRFCPLGPRSKEQAK